MLAYLSLAYLHCMLAYPSLAYLHCVLAYPSLAYLHCVLAYPSLAYLHLHTLTLAYFALGCFRSSTYTVVEVSVCKCKCRSVSVCSANVVEVSVCKCKCRSVSVQGIFRKNPSQCFREKGKLTNCVYIYIYKTHITNFVLIAPPLSDWSSASWLALAWCGKHSKSLHLKVECGMYI